jgi:hypothetical protein
MLAMPNVLITTLTFPVTGNSAAPDKRSSAVRSRL